MKKMIYLILIGIFCCQTEKKPEEKSPVFAGENNAWDVYEGRVPLNEKINLYIELSMLPSDQTGEGYFRLNEFTEADYNFTPSSTFKGKYSTLYGDGRQEVIIQFHNSAMAKGLKRTYVVHGFKGNITDTHLRMIREEPFRVSDLVVKIQAKNKLVVLDQSLQPVTTDPLHNLTRRSSRLFTVEGYFRHTGDTADFLEMNTKEKWAVSKLGQYHQAIGQYHKLVKDKFEVTYLKAIGYSVQHTDKRGRDIEALAFKKILQMTSSPGLTEEYNLLDQ
jgi:hypothetical protein